MATERLMIASGPSKHDLVLALFGWSRQFPHTVGFIVRDAKVLGLKGTGTTGSIQVTATVLGCDRVRPTGDSWQVRGAMRFGDKRWRFTAQYVTSQRIGYMDVETS